MPPSPRVSVVLPVRNAVVVFPRLPAFTDVWGELPLLHVVVLSALVAVLELFPIRLGRVVLNDNLYVPAVVTCAALALRS